MHRPAFNCDVLVTGEYFCDLIYAGLPEAPRLGAEYYARDLTVLPGGTYNIALALSRLGLDTLWACDFGNDLFSRLVMEQAERDGLDGRLFNRLDRSVQRVTSAFSLAGDRGFLSFSETPVAPPPANTLLQARPQWLVQTFRFEPEWLSFIEAAREQGVKIFADCRHPDFTLDTPGVRAFLAALTIFSPNEAEATGMTGLRNPEAALDRLGELVPVVAMKRGGQGASVIVNGERFDIAAPRVEVVDATGAGDAFNGGFLLGLVNRLPLQACVELAVLCGSLSTTGYGALAAPTLMELKEFANRHGREIPFQEVML
ncbi:carbohydrate kinase family protein [Devosia sp. D6-9]|nr:carbohydrate kinase family protein [Devosia sp. D6-9]